MDRLKAVQSRAIIIIFGFENELQKVVKGIGDVITGLLKRR